MRDGAQIMSEMPGAAMVIHQPPMDVNQMMLPQPRFSAGTVSDSWGLPSFDDSQSLFLNLSDS